MSAEGGQQKAPQKELSKEQKGLSKAEALGDEGTSPATILWAADNPPSPAFLPSATMSSGHEAMS